MRPISQETFDQIAALSGLSGPKSEKRLGDEYSFTSAIEIHGDSCKACGFNFGEVYGDHGSGFIHVHHVMPISIFEGKQVSIQQPI